MSKGDNRFNMDIGRGTKLRYNANTKEIEATLHGVTHLLLKETDTLLYGTEEGGVTFTKTLCIGYNEHYSNTPHWFEINLFADNENNFDIQPYKDISDLIQRKIEIKCCKECGQMKGGKE